MQFGEPLLIRGFVISYKKKGVKEPMYLKVNAYSDGEALAMAKKYVEDNLQDCEVVGLETTYKTGFTGVLN